VIDQEKIFPNVKFTKNEIYFFKFLPQKLYYLLLLLLLSLLSFIYHYYYYYYYYYCYLQILLPRSQDETCFRNSEDTLQFGRKHRLVIQQCQNEKGFSLVRTIRLKL